MCLVLAERVPSVEPYPLHEVFLDLNVLGSPVRCQVKA